MSQQGQVFAQGSTGAAGTPRQVLSRAVAWRLIDANPAESGDAERETSTNAQLGGAADEPWPGNS